MTYDTMTDDELNAAVKKMMGNPGRHHSFRPAESIADAFEVVDYVTPNVRKQEHGGMTDFTLTLNPYTLKWRAAFSWSDGYEVAHADASLPRAICIAALMAVAKEAP